MLTNFNNLLLLDIETVPAYSSYNKMPELWQVLWQEKASKYPNLQALTPNESYKERAGILAEFGKIIVISIAYFVTKQEHLQLKQKTISNHNETELLTQFVNLCNDIYKSKKSIQFAGHNIKEFDLPYICRRLVINQLTIPKYLNHPGQKPWENQHLDTLHYWRFGDYKNYISLKLLAACLNIPSSKTDIDGSQVQQVYYELNDLQRIANYCTADVQVVAQIILHLHNQPLLLPEHIMVA